MRVERVVARAFGPFRGEELNLAPGMTVVSGPNEAGKSTWHAALRLAITGLRRGKGPGTSVERQLAERHRPWDDPDRWQVEARLRLSDGRTIEVSQDLAGKVDCRAVDVGLGRDVSHEILDGTPDASRWLGLTRDTFAATISVSQAQIMAIAEAADELQGQMQRAAATHGTDATAADAIGRVEQFRRDAVGVDRVGARGPLRAAKDRLAALETRLSEARRQHEEYLQRAAEVDAAEVRLAEARHAALRAEASLAAARAADSRRRHEAATALAARHPAPPGALAARDELADAVAGALDAWGSLRQPPELSGPSAAELEREIADLPAAPIGDVEPHESVREALLALDLAENAVRLLEDAPAARPDDLPAVEEGRVRDLARRLRTPQLPGAADLEQELATAQAAADHARRSSQLPIMLLAAAVVALGAWVVAAGPVLVGIGLIAAGIGVGAWSWRSGASRRSASARVAGLQAAMAPYRTARAAAEADRMRARAEATSLGVPDDAASLDDLADRLAAAEAAGRHASEREARLAHLLARQSAAATALTAAIAARGDQPDGDARQAWERYESASRERAARSTVAGRREALSRQLDSRRAAEEALASARSAAEAAERRLRDVATQAGLPSDGSPEGLVAGLRGWQHQRADELRRNELAIGEWERLQLLLDGRRLEELGSEADVDAAAAANLREQLGEEVVPAAPPARLEVELAARRDELLAEVSRCDGLRGNMAARREALGDVSEAEEAVLAARAELARVESLADVLDRTIALLRSAEERVHRSLAPLLAASIGRWLPAVCRGAYVDVSVDPADLSVRVKEAATGAWREARLLSEGTREQIYLLLRVAMAEHLVTNGETAPLILDEVTVQSDPLRKRELLDVLHRLSADRQVILFTHDDDVLAWAGRRLDGVRDATILLRRRAGTPDADAASRELPPSAGLAATGVGD